MTVVILAEKPNQAAAYANAFEYAERKDGYYIVNDRLFSEDTFITYAIGHLLELATPGDYFEEWGNWDLNNLPIFPQTYEYKVSPSKSKQYNIVKKLLKQASTIIIATDAGREGSNIAWSIIKEAGAFSNTKKYHRLWIGSLEKDVVRKGFENLNDGLQDLSLYREAQTRQIADWLIGMNASPLYSMCLNDRGIKGAFSIGRVQTPTLWLIYHRQKQIEEFKQEKYYQAAGTVNVSDTQFKAAVIPPERFKDHGGVIEYLRQRQARQGQQEGYVKDVSVESKETESPKLFSLDSLQQVGNRLYEASPSEVLKAAQQLYDSKFLTYPRSDTEYITENEFEYLTKHSEEYCRFLNCEPELVQKSARKRYVFNQKVEEHHAIIPTKRIPTEEEFSALSQLQQKLYQLVVKTTVAMFYPNFQFDEKSIHFSVGDLELRSRGITETHSGWNVLFPKNKEDVEALPVVSKGDKVSIDISIVEKETTPPKRYTQGMLIPAMSSVGKQLDDEESKKILKEVSGIGTVATRAGIIENLIQKKYIEVKKNKVYVTEKGKILCQAVEAQSLLASAEMTAKWETYLQKIGRDQGGDQEQFITSIKKFIVHLIEHVPANIKELNVAAYEEEVRKNYTKNIVASCPSCSGDILLRKNLYGCSNYPKCSFCFSAAFRNKKLSKQNVKELVEIGETVLKKIKKKDKSSYNAKIKLTKSGQLTFDSFA